MHLESPLQGLGATQCCFRKRLVRSYERPVLPQCCADCRCDGYVLHGASCQREYYGQSVVAASQCIDAGEQLGSAVRAPRCCHICWLLRWTRGHVPGWAAESWLHTRLLQECMCRVQILRPGGGRHVLLCRLLAKHRSVRRQHVFGVPPDECGWFPR